MRPITSFARAADEVSGSLASYGLAGAILAVMVAPVLWALVKATQKRDDERSIQDREDAKARNDRAERMLVALETSVEHQKEAVAEWRAYVKSEEAVHAAIMQGLERLADKITP
jgi:predicted nucleic acid-binding protein